jgi:hypothetical protein
MAAGQTDEACSYGLRKVGSIRFGQGKPSEAVSKDVYIAFGI